MRLDTKKSAILILIFVVIYSLYIFGVDVTFDNYADIIVSATFFFSLFNGFFINRQNNRYTSVADFISITDGHFSYLYRVSGAIPRIQDEIREIVRNHYTKILESGNWAYHVNNPSNTITKVTETLATIKDTEIGSPTIQGYLDQAAKVLSELQVNRKQTVGILSEKLMPLHWMVVSILGTIVTLSFGFIPTEYIEIQVLKVLFGTAVFTSIILLIQLDQLTIFGKNAAESTAKDIFHILDEEDARLLSISDTE